MNKNEAAPRKHQLDGPPRLNSSRCGNDHIAAVGKKQQEFEKNKIVNIQKEECMNKVALVNDNNHVVDFNNQFSNEQIQVLKNSICKGATNEEFQIFLMACKKTQLDPFMRQIYAVKRWDSRLKRETMTVQTGIDGYRLIAERTERYAPGPKPTYEYDDKGNLVSATAYVKKMTKDGTWHVVEAEAFFEEYCQSTVDRSTGEKKATGMWHNMQRNQLAKCAESLALRKAFPAEMSGVYTREEMKQAEYHDVTPIVTAPIVDKISFEQAHDLKMTLDECDENYRNWVYSYIKKQYKTDDLSQLPLDIYDRMKSAAVKNMEQNHQRQLAELECKENELVAVEMQ